MKIEKKSNEVASGNGIAFAGVAVALALFMITLLVCFILIPQSKYNAAKALLESGKHVDAISAFKELGDYRDSNLQIEQIQNTVLEEKYKVAAEFLKNGEYDKAVEAFTEIKDYADSENKINEARNAIVQGKYDEAEDLFNNGKYTKAIKLYSEIGDYKNSKLRIEQIYNRLSKGKKIYFGTYNNSPIAWKIVKTEDDKLLLITKKPVEKMPFNEEIEKVAWKNCSLRKWLNEEFITSFSDDQQKQILSTDNGSTSDKVFLFDVNEVNDLTSTVSLETSKDWWTRTTDDNGCVYVSAKGKVQPKGEPVVRDKGVRPAVWISLK